MERVRCKTCAEINPAGRATCINCNSPLPKVSIKIGPPPKPQLNTEAVRFERGQVVADRYTVLDLVGKGGMGCIYKVRDNILGENVALKTLLPQFAQDRIVVERFFNEAKITRRLSHPNIVRVHDIGNADGVIYISMEFLEGQSLRSVMDHAGNDRRLPLDYVYKVLDQLCAALEYAHKYTIHRDIKPENVMICDDGTVKLMDFGISKLMASEPLTGAAMVMGTPMYMPPEQLRDSASVDARADLFSVGVMLYEMLTGHLPTGIPQPASHLYADVPVALDDIVARCVAQKPENRFDDAKSLRKILRASRQTKVGDTEVTLREVPAAAPAAANNRRLTGIALAAVLCVLTCLGLVAAEQHRRGMLAGTEPEGATHPFGSAALQAQLRARAEAAADTEEQRALFETAEARWDSSQDEALTTERRAALGREAFQYYLGALLIEDGMGFVPPGEAMVGGGVEYLPAFLIDQTEVTVRDFARFAGRENWRMPSLVRGTAARFPNHPIFGVTCFDAQAYAAANGKRLPTEAQWARAAYGGEGAPIRYPWGGAWERDASNMAARGQGRGTAPVKNFSQDYTELAGCWDLAGNVSEWTRTPANTSVETPGFGTEMIVRGGSHRMRPTQLTSRQTAPYEEARDDLGFRCVREIPVEPAAIKKLLASLP